MIKMHNIKEKSKYLIVGILIGIFINKSINIIKKEGKKEIRLTKEIDSEEIPISIGTITPEARIYIGNSPWR